MKKAKPPSRPLAEAAPLQEHDWWGMLALEAWSFLSIDLNGLRAYIASGAIKLEEERLQLDAEIEDALNAYRRGEHALAMKTVESTARACRYAQVVPLAQSGLAHSKAKKRGGVEGAKIRQQNAAAWHRTAEDHARALLAAGRGPRDVSALIAVRNGMPKADTIRRHLRKAGLI